ncbi:MAG: hypothetical protein AB1921_19055 [Thermodesulfobacteriota bacterium]
MQALARIRESLAFFKAFARPITILVAAYVIPLVLGDALYSHFYVPPDAARWKSWVPLAVGLFYRPFYHSCLIALLSSRETGRPFPAALWLSTSLRFWGRLVAIDMVTYLSILVAAGPAALLSAGFTAAGGQASQTFVFLASGLLVMAILLSLMIVARLSLASFFAVLEDRRLKDALKLSLLLTRPLAKEIMAGAAILYLALFTANLALGGVVALLDGNPVAAIVANLVLAVVAVIPLILFFRYYGIVKKEMPAAPLPPVEPG